ncbi:MAG: hypothetical protein JO166_06690 [Deltaproteobacteria bacterium]|nr:hypothetical protein [Deltaproteobacteria bacterium]
MLAIWIRIHWFEIATLVLLGLNLWFVFAVLKMLRAVDHWLGFFARWLDTTRDADRKER